MSEASKVPVFDLQNLIDPYPMYKQLRDEAPVYHVPELNMYYVTSYELLRHVIRDTKTYSSQYDDFMACSREAGLANLADDVREGDWIEIGQVGAYGSALRTHFNGFYPDTFVELRDSLSGVSEQKR